MKERYKNQEAIGGSAHADFFVSTDSKTGQRVFIKQFSQQSSRQFRVELAMYLNVESQHVVPLYDFFYLDDGSAALVTPYFQEGNLRDFFCKYREFSTQQVFEFLIDILSALIDLHEHGYVHGDIKPENILVEVVPDSVESDTGAKSKLNFYLADLGTVTHLDTSTKDRLPAGTPAYRAPELSRFQYSEASDIYSLGITLYHLLSGKIDLENVDFHELKVLNLLKIDNPDFRDIISNLTFRNENQRVKSARFLRDWVQELKLSASHSVSIAGSDSPKYGQHSQAFECSFSVPGSEKIERIELCTHEKNAFLVVKHSSFAEFINLSGSFSNSRLLSRDVFLFNSIDSAQIAAISMRQGIELIQCSDGDLTRTYERLGSEKIQYLSINDNWVLWNDGAGWSCRENHSLETYSPGIDTRYYGEPKGVILNSGWYAISHGNYNQKVSIGFKGRIAKTCVLGGAVESIFAAEAGFLLIERKLGSLTGQGFWFFGVNEGLRSISVPSNIKQIFDDHSNIFLISDDGEVFLITRQRTLEMIATLEPGIEVVSLTLISGSCWAIEKLASNSYRLIRLSNDC